MMIGELAKRSGLSKDGLRHYEALGLIHSSPVAAGSRTYRIYDDTTLERLSLISLAKRLGFKLRELTESLDRLFSDTVSREERAQIISEKVAEVDIKIEELTAARDLLAAFIVTPDKEFMDEMLKDMGLWLE
ncbi:MerR family transcriptional regulator [Octadecabacter sp. G9-8]|uniref:MerR family transcriptional regulator n=1 Tax=Octadecabacter dasysiphoniae TaxID=2909341 RepID=A0ABS9CTE9_9RHOB|nr:MerR family transcriptional regulator [Octadecabacter dasysiphoniae]MCF2870501.1 MerR family transcriptional regulator [Octadecabacter dasysiphoniae]